MNGQLKSREETKSQEENRVARKKILTREMSQWFAVPEGRKVGSLKRRVRSHVTRWEVKNCTPLWRKAQFQVKMLKNWRSQAPGQFWKLGRLKIAPRYGAKHGVKSKCKKHHSRTTFWSFDVETWHGAHLQVKMFKTWNSAHFLKFRCRKMVWNMFGGLYDRRNSWIETHLVSSPVSLL